MKEFFPTRFPEEIIGDVQQRLGEEEWLSSAVSVHVDVKQRLQEELRFRIVVGICLSGKFSSRSDRRDVPEVVWYLVIKVYICEGHLSAPASGQLVEFKYQLLCKLFVLIVCPPHQIGGKVHVDGVPSNGSGKVVLQHRCHLEYVGKEHVGVLRRVGDACYRRDIKAVAGNVRDALPGTIRTVDHSQVMQVDVSLKMRIGYVFCEYFCKCVFLEDHLCYRKIYRFWVVARIAVFLVFGEHHLLKVVYRKAYPAVVGKFCLQASLKKLDVDHFTDDRCRDMAPPIPQEFLFHLKCYAFGCGRIDSCLYYKGVPDPAGIPGRAFFLGESIDHKRKVCRLPLLLKEFSLFAEI